MSNTHTPELFLAGRDFAQLGNEATSISDWFLQWDASLMRNDWPALLNLLHWGLQSLPSRDASTTDLVRIFRHYLLVADGHQNAKNFGSSTYKLRGWMGELSRPEVLQKLADKAWVELCNRFFVFHDEGTGVHLRYESLLMEPELAREAIKFFDSKRWRACDTYWAANVRTHEGDNYDKKAIAFFRKFLKFAWNFGDELVGTKPARDYFERKFGDGSEEKAYAETLQYFRKLRPQLVELFREYDQLGFLFDRKLDRPTRQALEALVRRSGMATSIEGRLEDRYGEQSTDPRFAGMLTLNSREPARILLLYPLLQRGRRKFIRAMNAQKRHEAEIKKVSLRDELEIRRRELKELEEHSR
ncbi:MAG: hypothetical protein JWO40_872 [Candidatus Doudnabacteria bacterium]|nr:hypothetical protein [Candidatus Doudnabacteria bacterium]